ncbi:MAG: hypothetical protein A4E19_06605 [Nitrospira sp. SG-bin1]|nr:MAG: hypothetical protein A4E19_06605 [Nitrospira sp. SG-bin1]
MLNRTYPMRRHSRFPVSWPMLYGNDAFLAEGTVLDLTALGWRVAGTMPVVAGMQVNLQVSVPERSAPLRIHRATVLWVNDHEFAIEAHEMASIDQVWVTQFLKQKLGLMWMSRTTDQATPILTKPETPRGETTVPQPFTPSMKDILHRFSAIDLASTDLSIDVRWNSETEPQEDQPHPLDHHVPDRVLRQAHHIVRSMVAIKTLRARTGRNPIPDN